MKKKDILFYGLLFCLFLVWNLFIQPLHSDEVWNYGFAHNIYKGLVPYRDFNMVITPFYPFLLSLGFHIFGSNILVAYLVQLIFFIVFVYLSIKLVGINSNILLAFLFFPMSITFVSYNFFSLFLLICLVYMEKFQKNDYWIGVVLALEVLTKQTVGLCLLLPSLFYWKEKSKLFKRFVGFLIPITVFLLFLFLTKSFSSFINLCFLGLFDFAGENSKVSNFCLFLFFLFLAIAIYIIKKNPKEIANYYCLAFISMVLPLFDAYHTQVAFFGIALMIFLNYEIHLRIHFKIFLISIIVGISLVLLIRFPTKMTYPNDIPHFQYKLIDGNILRLTKKLMKFVQKNQDKNIIYVNSNAYYIKLTNDVPINYFDLINAGNWGFHGSDRLFSEVMKVPNAVFLVDVSEVGGSNQTDKRILTYIITNGTIIDSVEIFDVYILEEDNRE